MLGMQSGFRSWRNGGNRRMKVSRGRERQRSQLVSVCAGRSVCSAARCLPEKKQASDYVMNVKLNVYHRRVWLSRSEADHITVPNHLQSRLWGAAAAAGMLRSRHLFLRTTPMSGFVVAVFLL